MKEPRTEVDAVCAAGEGIDQFSLLDDLDDPILLLNEDLHIKYINKACLGILGRSPEELIGMPFLPLLQPDLVRTVQERLLGCLKSEKTSCAFEWCVIEQEGSATAHTVFAVSKRLHDGRLYLLLHLKNAAAPEQGRGNTVIQGRVMADEDTDPIFIQTEGNFVYLNPSAYAFFGADTPQALIGTPVLDRVRPENREIVRTRIQQLNVGRQPVGDIFEQEFIRLDGSGAWAETKGMPFIYEGKNGALVFMRDTTERRAAAEALRKSEEKYSILFNKTSVPSFLMKFPELSIVEVNDAWVNLLEYSREEVVGRRTDEMGITCMSPKIAVLTEEIERNSFADNIEMTVSSKSGRKLTVLSNIHILTINNERFAIVTNQDITERKKAEEKLFEINARFQKYFDYSPIGMSLTGLDATLLNVNRKICELFGYAKEELEGKTYDEMTFPEDTEIALKATEKMMSGRTDSETFVKRYVRKNGDVFWASVTSAILRDKDDRPVNYITQVQDISERKKMEEELQARQRFNQLVMDNLPIGISVNSFKPPLGFEYMNDNFPRFYRTTREALRGTDVFFDAVYEDPDFRQAIRTRVLEDMRSGDPKRMRWENVPITRRGAETRYITAYNAQVPDKDIQISIVTDETAHVLALDALEKNAARFRNLHEFDMKILRGFDSYKQIEETALGYVFELIGAGEAGIAVLRADDHIIETMKSQKGKASYEHVELEMPVEDTTLFRVLQRSTIYDTEEITDERLITRVRQLFKIDKSHTGLFRPLYAAHGPIGILYVGRNDGGYSKTDRDMIQEIGIQSALAIEQKRLKGQNERYATGLEDMIRQRTSQLEEAVKELEAFTYSVSHDLRAPLRSMNGFVRILLEDYGDVLDDEGKRVCNVIGGSAQQMGRLIDDLLALSRIGRSSMVLTPVDMTQMIKSLFIELTTEEQRARIDFSVGCLPEAAVDTTLIRQVWINLLDNAVKFSSKRPDARIRVEGKVAGNEIVYSVSDNGAGFDMQYKDKLFGVFQRLHSVKEFDGTGVGLAIVQRIIQRHGGRVWATGEVDKGATFFFSIRKETASDETGSD